MTSVACRNAVYAVAIFCCGSGIWEISDNHEIVSIASADNMHSMALIDDIDVHRPTRDLRQGTPRAEPAAAVRRYSIVESRGGVILLDTATGETWLLIRRGGTDQGKYYWGSVDRELLGQRSRQRPVVPPSETPMYKSPYEVPPSETPIYKSPHEVPFGSQPVHESCHFGKRA